MKPVVVIGAGIGGLSAAIRLAAAGRKVLILEQNAAVGGKMKRGLTAYALSGTGNEGNATFEGEQVVQSRMIVFHVFHDFR